MLTKGLLLAIDANSLLHRAYHAYPLTLTTADGQPVNAAYGFTSMLLDTLLMYKPEYVFCAFDTAKPTFRHTSYVGYKANRPKTDSELTDQIPYVFEVLRSLNIPIFAIEGFEADDILGTVCHHLETTRSPEISQTYILTGDRDLFQLVNERVQAVLPKGSFKNLEQYTEEKVYERMGVSPAHVTDLKGLMGDASDNIPGVKGIGPKTATDLLNKYQSLEEIYAHMDDIEKDNKRIAQILKDGHDSALMSKTLATISKETPLTFSAEAAETKGFDPGQVGKLFAKLQFKSLFSRLNKFVTLTGAQKITMEDETVAEKSSVDEDWAALLTKYTDVTIGTTEVIPVLGKTFWERVAIVNDLATKSKIRLSIYCNEQLYSFDVNAPFLNVNGVNSYIFGIYNLLTGAPVAVLEKELATDFLAKTLDIELLSYLLHTGRDDYSLQEQLAQCGLGTLDGELQQNAEVVAKIALIRIAREFEKASEYKSLPRITALWKVRPEFKKNNESIPVCVARHEDLPAAFGVALMHNRGITIDLRKVQTEITSFKEKLAQLEKEIYDIAGFEFNIRSTKQLANVLFGNLGLPNAKKTKTGFSTDDEVLQGLVDAHPIIEKILSHRQLAKLISTYMEPYMVLAQTAVATKEEEKAPQMSLFEAPAQAPSQTEQPRAIGDYLRVHSTFLVTATSSGRLSSINPNLQNLPVKTNVGKVIRQFFVPEPGKKLVSIDYSQIDLRVLAHISQDEGLLEAFRQGKDIHRITAAKVFHLPFEEVTDMQRRFAKSINFGLMYGMSSFGLSRSIGVDVHEAAKFMSEYFAQFPMVKTYMAETIASAKETGYVVSLLGRRRYIAGIDSNNKMRVQAAEREAINMPIQGGADDIMRLAIGKISQLPEILSGKIKLVLQVHDEFVFEMPDDAEFIDKETKIVRDIMENVLSLSIPLQADSAVGETLDL